MNSRAQESLQLQAIAIATPSVRLLAKRPPIRAVQLFERSVNLVTQHGEIISLITVGADPGPFSIVVDTHRQHQQSIGQLLRGNGRDIAVDATEVQLQVGRLTVSLGDAKQWEPRLTQGWLLGTDVYTGLEHISALLGESAAHDSLPIICGGDGESPAAIQIQRAGKAIRRAIGRNSSQMCFVGARLAAGVGIGLTPAGDDFLVGVLLAIWLRMPEPDVYLNEIVAGATERTGQLSMALLRAAARGEASQAWHGLVEALARREQTALASTVRELLKTGHTSGADALFGFVVALEAIHQVELDDSWYSALNGPGAGA